MLNVIGKMLFFEVSSVYKNVVHEMFSERVQMISSALSLSLAMVVEH